MGEVFRKAAHMPLDEAPTNGNSQAEKPSTANDAQPGPDATSQPTNSRDDKPQKPAPHWTDKSIVVLTGLILFTYIVLTYFSCQQMKLTRDQVHIGQRAYLIVHEIAFKDKLAIGKPTMLTYKIKNTGQTPAMEIRSDLNYAFVLPTEPGATAYSLQPMVPYIAASQEITNNVGLISPLTKEEFDEITRRDDVSVKGSTLSLAQHAHFYTWGLINYKDVFGGEGQLEFCAVYMASIDEFVACKTHQAFK
jgi:hypothetical protein